MKRYTILVILLFVVCFSEAQSFKGGLVIGLAATQVTGDKLSGYNHPGAQLGVFTELPIGAKSSLRMEMYYIQKGSRKNSSEVDPSSYVQRLNYIEVPLFYQYKPFNKLSFHAGLSCAYLISAVDLVDGDKMPSYWSDSRNKYDFSIQGGGLWSFNDKWKIRLNYSYSVLPIRDMPSVTGMVYHDRKQFNDVVLISLYRYF
ncbi:MAG: porin family protein [Bacteroidota bacterium]